MGAAVAPQVEVHNPGAVPLRRPEDRYEYLIAWDKVLGALIRHQAVCIAASREEADALIEVAARIALDEEDIGVEYVYDVTGQCVWLWNEKTLLWEHARGMAGEAADRGFDRASQAI